MKTINYDTIINYYEKKGCKIIKGIDTTVYDLQMTQEDYKDFKLDFQKFTINTSDRYFTLENYPGLEFKTTANSYKHGLSLNVSFTGSDIPTIEAIQIYANAKIQKLTIYGLFYRYCELAKMDRQQFYKDICKKLGYPVPKNEILHRGDLKIDIIGVSVNEFMKKLKNNNRDIEKRIGLIYQKKGELETVYLGDKSSKYAFPRIYDKNKDTIKKGKQVFYEEYLKQPVTRIEIQCGSNFIGELNTEQRVNKVQSYIGDKKSTFKGNYYVGKRYDPNFILNTDYFDKRVLNTLLKASNSNHTLQPTFETVNKNQNKYLFTCTPIKGLTKKTITKNQNLPKEKPLLFLRQ